MFFLKLITTVLTEKSILIIQTKNQVNKNKLDPMPALTKLKAKSKLKTISSLSQ